MLVGSEIFMELICNESNLKDTYPNLTKTKLGQVISGRSTINVKALTTQNNLKDLSHLVVNDNLDLQLQRFWSLDEANPTNKLS